MGRTCAVFNCNTNLKLKTNGEWVRTDYKPAFKWPYVPKEEGNVTDLLKHSPSDSQRVKNAKDLTLLWVKSIPNDTSSLIIRENNGLCSDHFKESDYYTDAGDRVRLNKDTVLAKFEIESSKNPLF